MADSFQRFRQVFTAGGVGNADVVLSLGAETGAGDYAYFFLDRKSVV